MLKSPFSLTGKAFEGKCFPLCISKSCSFSDFQPVLTSSWIKKRVPRNPIWTRRSVWKKLARCRPYRVYRSSLYSSHSMHFLCWIDNSLTTCMPIALRRGKEGLRDEKRQPESYNSDFHRAFRLRCSWNSFVKPCELSHWRNISSDTIVGERKDLKLWKYNHKCSAE